MIADPLTVYSGISVAISDPPDDNPVEFTSIKTEPTGNTRLNVATELSLPEFLVIRHSLQGKGDKTIDRHLVQLMRSERDELTGLVHSCVLNLTLTVPRVGLFTETEVRRQMNLLTQFLNQGSGTSTTLHRLLRGET